MNADFNIAHPPELIPLSVVQEQPADIAPKLVDAVETASVVGPDASLSPEFSGDLEPLELVGGGLDDALPKEVQAESVKPPRWVETTASESRATADSSVADNTTEQSAFNPISVEESSNAAAEWTEGSTSSLVQEDRVDLAQAEGQDETTVVITNNAIVDSIEQAQTLARNGRAAEAIPMLETILSNDPSNSSAQSVLAEAHLWLGNFKDAEKIYQMLLKQESDSRQYRLGLAKAYKGQWKMGRAMETLNPLLKESDADALKIAQEIQSPHSQTTFEGYWKEGSESFQALEEEVKFRINNSDTLQRVSVGAESYQKEGVKNVVNLPLRVGIEGQVNNIQLSATVGADVFPDTTDSPYVKLNAKARLTPELYVLGGVTYERYKDDAAVIRNQVSRWKLEPGLYWQIDPNTSLYGGYALNHYSDDNTEQEVILEAKRELGDFYVSAVGMYESFSDSSTSNYFAPASYWFYSGEAGWEGKIGPNSTIKLSGAVGQQHYPNGAQNFYSVQTGWMQEVSNRLNLELNYRYSNQSPFPSSTRDENEHSLRARINYRF